MTLIEQIKRHEGSVISNNRHMPYTDSVGKTTIGYGRNIDDVGISEQEAHFLLMNDIRIATSELYENFDWFGTINKTRQDVLINMCFNIGINRLKGFKNMIAALKRQDFDDAAKEMLDSKWARQVKGRADELAEQMRKG